ALHWNGTGEGTRAPLAGAMSAGVPGLAGQPLLSIAVKRKCDDADEQFGPAASTHHSTLPPGTLPWYTESVVTASSVAEPPLNAAKRRYDVALFTSCPSNWPCDA